MDLNDHLCGPDICPAVIGGVIVYSDNSHLTRTYALSLISRLDEVLRSALSSAR